MPSTLFSGPFSFACRKRIRHTMFGNLEMQSDQDIRFVPAMIPMIAVEDHEAMHDLRRTYSAAIDVDCREPNDCGSNLCKLMS